jgi:anti-sigma regulatory factor (Ser/Thr protein kinase)
MSIATQESTVGHGDHVVQFYAHDRELAETVGEYLADAARSGAVAIVIATDVHRGMFEAQLDAAGIDLAAAGRDGTFVSLDAAETMARFTVDGRIDADAFDRVIGTTVRKAVQSGRPVRAYGEMVALLWDAGNVLAAIELEKLWNALGSELRFSLFCAYHSVSVSGAEHAEALEQVCTLHSSVLEAPVCGHFPAAADGPRAARRLVGDAVRQWGHDRGFAGDAELVLSELATNAVVHARSEFSVVVRRDGAGVHIAVRDASPVAPEPRDAGPMSSSGRGLRLVAELCEDWGVDLASSGKTVWASLRP